jgi:hypothetical protein
MKKRVSKIGAAKSQILEAINLFFEDRDPVSIHTLIGASKEILNDHFNDIGEVWDHSLILHGDSIYVKDEYRKQWKDSINKAKNFFKHADRDLKSGINEIEFDSDLNELFIWEAIRQLQLVEKDDFIMEPEFTVFNVWFMKEHPDFLKKGQKHISDQLQSIKWDGLQDYRSAIAALKNQNLIVRFDAV